MDSEASASGKLTNADKCKQYRSRLRPRSSNSVDLVKKHPLTNAQRCKRYRNRKRGITEKPKAVVPRYEIRDVGVGKLDDYCRICERGCWSSRLIKLEPYMMIYNFVKSLNYYEMRNPFMVCTNCFRSLHCKKLPIPSRATVNEYFYPNVPKDLPILCPVFNYLILPQISFASLENIKVENGQSNEDVDDSRNYESGLEKIEITKTEISAENITQDNLSKLENIKVENGQSNDVDDIKNYEFGLEKIEITKTEISAKNIAQDNLSKDIKVEGVNEQLDKIESVPMLQKDPLLEGYQPQEEISKKLGLEMNQTYSLRRRSNTGIHAALFKYNISEIRPFPCKVCGKHFKSKKYCERHERLHSGDRPFPCNQCDKRFQYHSTLRAHKASHQNDMNISCQQCGKLFKRKIRLIRHIRSAHLVKKVHTCSYCGIAFSQKNGLRSHLKTHTGK